MPSQELRTGRYNKIYCKAPDVLQVSQDLKTPASRLQGWRSRHQTQQGSSTSTGSTGSDKYWQQRP
jgi:hypothetical protein